MFALVLSLGFGEVPDPPPVTPDPPPVRSVAPAGQWVPSDWHPTYGQTRVWREGGEEVRPAPRPFAQTPGTTPATTVPFAAGASTSSPAPVPFAGRTLIPVRPGILGGTNCPPSG